ncbi:PAS domain-containing methyl-accepting chemotaxis protein [Xanthobacteraceae bacterium Astr-EGSB]|uniref:methyl-accepting chemotaxis protein n=1 Tax=Astrobacterium formosum TaxID=3069710 RepID=UPI0027B073FF|nr:PAS domain-containing methyl-accepting chemotaxis protein [Xanthobacteraceae bacterium Astr-EGSB]
MGLLPDRKATLAALSRSQAVIEFKMDGTILTANRNFLSALGYELGEIKGRHHSMFVDPADRNSPDYKAFWEALNRGEYQAAEYKRIGKGGKEVWIQASYNPILGRTGRPYKVVKYATDISARKLQNADYEGQIAAIGKSQAVIQFNMDGTVIDANENFLNALGYTLDEIRGRHHSMFVDAGDKNSAAYRAFWEALNRGEYQAAEYKRLGKGGKEVWIQASYNPILDLGGKPFKVVKFATDVTARKLREADFAGQIAAIGKSQAVIEFDMDGTIMGANENFLNALGYTLEEIRGRHHSVFVDAVEKASPAYRAFWQSLNRGEFQAAEYRRVGKGGKEVFIQASYNPIFDLSGKPFKVVKYATDVTANVHERQRRADIQREIDEDIRQITTAIASATEQAASAAAASVQTSANVQAVASGAEELVASIGEINHRVTDATKISADAVDQGTRTRAIMTELAAAATRVGEVVGLISTIAGQTNLLALNATIEAARAGEAGKGFAVVASEVKLLATQTAKATEDITRQIDGMQNATEEAVKAIESIAATISHVNDISTTIASAVEEQSAVTREISSNMQTAATGVDTISKNMNEIAASTKQAADSTRKVESASRELAA